LGLKVIMKYWVLGLKVIMMCWELGYNGGCDSNGWINLSAKGISVLRTGVPDGILSYQKFQLGIFLGGLGMVGILYGYLEYFYGYCVQFVSIW
jgi:hypothetical protein